jgi:hypothetical protein
MFTDYYSSINNNTNKLLRTRLSICIIVYFIKRLDISILQYETILFLSIYIKRILICIFVYMTNNSNMYINHSVTD